MSSDAASRGGHRIAVVVAHPDDEALWLSSVIGSADRIVLCFGALFMRPRTSLARARAVAALPLSGLVYLALPESGAGPLRGRGVPQPGPYGLRIDEPLLRTRYEGNYARLVAALREVLKGCSAVYTHNPWGEYGHSEHIQVYRAVCAVQRELGFTLWFSNYVGHVSWPLAQRWSKDIGWEERRISSPDVGLARRLAHVYRRYGAWTWKLTHRWPAHETLYALSSSPSGSGGAGHPFSGETLLDVAALSWWPSLSCPTERRLPAG